MCKGVSQEEHRFQWLPIQDDRRRGTGRQGQAYAPQISRDLSPEDGEVRSVSPPSRRDSATPPTMDVYPLSPKLAKADNLLLSSGDAFMPPLPTGPSPYPQFQQTRPQEPGLAEQAAQLEAKCQVGQMHVNAVFLIVVESSVFLLAADSGSAVAVLMLDDMLT